VGHIIKNNWPYRLYFIYHLLLYVYVRALAMYNHKKNNPPARLSYVISGINSYWNFNCTFRYSINCIIVGKTKHSYTWRLYNAFDWRLRDLHQLLSGNGDVRPRDDNPHLSTRLKPTTAIGLPSTAPTDHDRRRPVRKTNRSFLSKRPARTTDGDARFFTVSKCCNYYSYPARTSWRGRREAETRDFVSPRGDDRPSQTI